MRFSVPRRTPLHILGAAFLLGAASPLPVCANALYAEELEHAKAQPNPASNRLAPFSFMVGDWHGGSDFVFEEIWSEPMGGVMTAMARGVRNGELAVLEYIVIDATGDNTLMRFKHFNADYSVWEGEEDTPITLTLTDHGANRAVFSAPNAQDHVQEIIYSLNDQKQLVVDVKLLENDEMGGFTLVFDRRRTAS